MNQVSEAKSIPTSNGIKLFTDFCWLFLMLPWLIQVTNWFINARVRLWKPMIEEMYRAEFDDASMDSDPSAEDHMWLVEHANLTVVYQKKLHCIIVTCICILVPLPSINMIKEVAYTKGSASPCKLVDNDIDPKNILIVS